MCVIGIFGAVASIFSGNLQKKAVDKASAAQIDYDNRSLAQSQKQFETTRSDYKPYTDAGVAAIGSYGNLLGVNGAGAQGTAVAGLKADPFFQQNLDDANTNLLQTASATGGVRGGNTAGAIGQLSPALLQQYYQQALSGYRDLAGLGLGATGSVAGAGQANTQNVIGLNGQIGNTLAAKYITKGGINAATIGNFGTALDEAAKSIAAAYGGFGGFGMPSAATVENLGPVARNTISNHPSIF